MKALLAVTMILGLSAGRGALNDTTLGAGVTIKEPTPIPVIVNSPQDYVGKRVRIDGIATAVCEEMGCWMAVADSARKEAPTIRLKVEHDGAIVFPMSAKGKQVSAEGVFEVIGGADAHATDASAEHAKQDPKASTQYQIKATGALIK
jgi:hypothetical protein